MLGEIAIRQQMSPLPGVGACSVQTHQRDARAIFLEVDAVHRAFDLDVDVAADHGLDVADHGVTRRHLKPRQCRHVLEILQVAP